MEGKNKKIILRIFLAFAVFGLAVFSFFSGAYLSQRSKIVREIVVDKGVYIGKVLGQHSEGANVNQDVDFNLFWDVWDTLKEEYVDKGEINEKQMFYGAIEGMVAALDDPYTVFMDPKKTFEFEEDMSGSFEGIGAEISIKDEILTVVAPLEGTPAEKAGLKSGDKVFAIDGESTAGITIDEAVNKIRGEKGTEVILTVARKGEEDLKDISIVRGVIEIKSVKTEMRDDGIFVIEMSNFNDDTAELFNKVVGDVLKNNPKGLILDLRNNPGGYLDTAIEVSSEWIEDGVIVTEKFSEEDKTEYLARGRARLSGFPTVILVNQGSASASEIVAGALHDHDKAEIVGEQTFGKGSVQGLRSFSDGSSVKITVAKWLTPEGKSISEEGITPDFEIEYTVEQFKADCDPQMNKALEILGGKFEECEVPLEKEN